MLISAALAYENWKLTSPLEWPVLRGGAGPGWASCISGATISHRQNSTTPLKFMQIEFEYFLVTLPSKLKYQSAISNLAHNQSSRVLRVLKSHSLHAEQLEDR
ncbi:hypothetical protein PUN28_019450 [Cardiocondyla obscurior]|uniref:Uncharacterized protein n=1 Tax=Cardiocondyla obscurior TaxID=286306 RepID=A0AAW2EB84_9HYME